MSRGSGRTKGSFFRRHTRQRNIKDATKTTTITLKEKLHQIYYGSVNLDTTCKGRCECCRVAMPQIHFSEFSQLINEIWDTTSRSEKIEMICTSIEYFFRNQFEKWGMESLVKPCILLSKEGRCVRYESRPLNCRIYGLWPKDDYKDRVDKFEQAYEGLLKREELPLNTQCPNVKRVDESVPITSELLDKLFAQLDELDKKVGNFTDAQVQHKENYRTFSDFLLWKIFGEEWLIKLTDFVVAADKNAMVDMIEQLKKTTREKFAKDMPDIREKQ